MDGKPNDELPSLTGPAAPAAIDWDSSWYDILGVAPGATKRQIDSAFRKLSLIYHPDKGGALLEYQRLGFIKEILTGAKRGQYDTYGREHFREQFPMPTPPPSAGPSTNDAPHVDSRDFVYRL